MVLSPRVCQEELGEEGVPYQLLEVVILVKHLHQTQDALLHDGVVFQLQFEDRCIGLWPSQWKRKEDKEVVSD